MANTLWHVEKRGRSCLQSPLLGIDWTILDVGNVGRRGLFPYCCQPPEGDHDAFGELHGYNHGTDRRGLSGQHLGNPLNSICLFIPLPGIILYDIQIDLCPCSSFPIEPHKTHGPLDTDEWFSNDLKTGKVKHRKFRRNIVLCADPEVSLCAQQLFDEHLW